MSRFLVPISILAVLVISHTASAENNLEEPEFEVVHKGDGFEIRDYKPYIVAETVVTGKERKAGNNGFRILAGYIFGNNTAGERMEMTTPVTTRGVKMNMTAPVTMKESKDGHVMRFVMERKYTMKTLPKPNDSRVSLIEVPARTVAVMRYRGKTNNAVFATKRAILLERLADANIKTIGQPVKAVFNGPWTPSLLRRNEVQVEVEWDKEQAK